MILRRASGGAVAVLLLVGGAACEPYSHTDSPTMPPTTPIVYRVSGVVLEYPSNLVVPQATVRFQDRSSTTNEAGEYQLNDLRVGGDNISVSKPGYITQAQILTISAGRASYVVNLYIARAPTE